MRKNRRARGYLGRVMTLDSGTHRPLCAPDAVYADTLK